VTERNAVASENTVADGKPADGKPADGKPADGKQQSAKWTITPPTPWDTSSFAGFRAVLREDLLAIDTSPLAPGYIAIAVHRFGDWIRDDSFPKALRLPALILHKLLVGYVRTYLGFEIHQTVRLGRRVRFHHQHGVVIDSSVVIGDDCVLHHNVTLAARRRVDSPKSQFHGPQIGAGVRIGSGSIILGGVLIGDGSTIGPNAVVTTDVPPGASAVAQSARVLRIR